MVVSLFVKYRDLVMKNKNIFYVIKRTFQEWSDDNASTLAAALSYYTIFSLAPMLVLIIAIAGLLGGGQGKIYGYIMDQISNLMGPQGAAFIASMIQSANKPSTGLIATILGAITLLLGALGIFGQLQNSLNLIWEVKQKPVKGVANSVKNIVKKRILSFAMLLVIIFLLLVSLIISAALSALGNYIGNTFTISNLALQWINIGISLLLITLLFAMIFKYLPDAEIRWRDVWFGAFITALLFVLGKFAIGLYLGRSNVGSTFGAAGALVIVMIWIYYSAQILFLGAEFTQVFAKVYGAKIVPEPDAVKVTKVEREEPAPSDGNENPHSQPEERIPEKEKS